MEDIDLSTVPREELEAFASTTMRRLSDLEESFTKLQEQLRVDPNVIDGWRSWIDTIDKEREKWMETSTRLSTELHHERQENSRFFQHVKDLTVTLERIHDVARRNVGDQARMLDLRRAIVQIAQQAGAAMAEAYESVLGWPDQLQHEIELPPETEDDEPQQATS